MTDFSGLSGLDSVMNQFTIQGNFILENLTGLENLTYAGDLKIFANYVLEDITALSNLQIVEGELRLENNIILATLLGLENVLPDRLDYIFMQNNNDLSYCHVKSVCDFLEAGGDHYIAYNIEGCDSSEEILSWCDSVSTAVYELSTKFQLYPNPTSGKFQMISYSNIDVEYELTDASGRLLQKGFIETIDLSFYTNGVYFVKLAADEQRWVERIVKVAR